MDPEEKEMLRRTMETVRDNNKMLHSIQRSMFWSKLFRYVYWIIIIGAAIGAYYFIDPYVGQIIRAYDSIKGNVSGLIQR